MRPSFLSVTVRCRVEKFSEVAGETLCPRLVVELLVCLHLYYLRYPSFELFATA
jgi:hypothetical protein